MNDDTILSGPKPQPDGADQPSLLQPTPAAPSSPTGAPTTTISLEVPPAAAEAVQQTLATVIDTIGSSLFPKPAPAPAAPRSSPAAQALAAGVLLGVGAKYKDRRMQEAGQALARHAIGVMPAAVAKPFKGSQRKGKSKNTGKRRGR